MHITLAVVVVLIVLVAWVVGWRAAVLGGMLAFVGGIAFAAGARAVDGGGRGPSREPGDAPSGKPSGEPGGEPSGEPGDEPSGEPGLDEEYRHWQLARRIMRIGCTPAVGKRCRTMLEGWIFNNYRAPKNAAEHAKYGALAGAMENVGKLEAALTHAGVAPAEARRIRGEIEALRDGAETLPGAEPARIEEGPEEIRYRSLVLKATPRHHRLIELAGTEATTRLYLRYMSMLAGAHHWSVPEVVFARMWDEGVRNEAFASPMNSRVLGRKGGHFFSPFIDVDAPFGSLGDVFKAPPEKLRRLKGGWEINPPFLSDVLRRAAAVAVELAKTKDVLFITRRADPGWRSPYAALEEVAVATIVLPAGAHAYQVEGPQGVDLRAATFDTHLLYAGPRSEKEAKRLLASLRDAWPTPIARG